MLMPSSSPEELNQNLWDGGKEAGKTKKHFSQV